jgi:hypothetical protein
MKIGAYSADNCQEELYLPTLISDCQDNMIMKPMIIKPIVLFCVCVFLYILVRDAIYRTKTPEVPKQKKVQNRKLSTKIQSGTGSCNFPKFIDIC